MNYEGVQAVVDCQVETAYIWQAGRAGNEFRGDRYESHLDDGESRYPHDERQDLEKFDCRLFLKRILCSTWIFF